MLARSAVVLALIMCTATTSFAAPSRAERNEARALSVKAAKAQRGGDHERAMALLQEADALAPSSQIRLDLARAQISAGKLVEAEALLEALLLPNASPRTDWRVAQAARKLLTSLKDRLPSLSVDVQGVDPLRAIVQVDGEAVTAGQAVKVNPGAHEIQAYAEGMKDILRTVSSREGEHHTLVVHFEPVPAPPAQAAEPSGVGARLPAAIALGVGGAGIALGSVFGILAIRDKSRASEHCVGSRCAVAAQPYIDSSLLKGDVATASFIVGGVGIAAGVTLLLTVGRSTDPEPDEGSVATIVPWVSPMGAGVSGTF